MAITKICADSELNANEFIKLETREQPADGSLVDNIGDCIRGATNGVGSRLQFVGGAAGNDNVKPRCPIMTKVRLSSVLQAESTVIRPRPRLHRASDYLGGAVPPSLVTGGGGITLIVPIFPSGGATLISGSVLTFGGTSAPSVRSSFLLKDSSGVAARARGDV